MALWMILVGLSITVVSPSLADHFQYPVTDSCVILDTEATFNLSVINGNVKRFQLFSLENATVAVSSSCITADSPTLLDLILFPYGDKLSFSFQDKGEEVQLFVFYQINVTAHFQDVNVTIAPVLDDATHLPVGTRNTSYECRSSETIIFDKDLPKYYMTMTMRNTHLQAFNLKGNNFSPATVCDDDLGTSTPQVTSDITWETDVTETTPGETTPDHTTVVTTPETTVTPPGTDNTYFVQEDGIVCLVMIATIKLDINYMAKDGTAMTNSITIPESAQNLSTGACAKTTNTLDINFFTNWTLTFVWGQDGALDSSILFLSEDPDVTYSLKSVSLTYTLDEEHFKNVYNPSDVPLTVSQKMKGGQLSGSNSSSYKCEAPVSITLNSYVSLSMSDLQYRAFGMDANKNITDGSGDVIDCKDEKNSDGDSDTTIGIVIGSCLGGLCIISAIVYTLTRYRTRNQYQQV